MDVLDDSQAQSLRSSEGKRLENVVRHILNTLLNNKDIYIEEVF